MCTNRGSHLLAALCRCMRIQYEVNVKAVIHDAVVLGLLFR